jgi:hypothetical protein
VLSFDFGFLKLGLIIFFAFIFCGVISVSWLRSWVFTRVFFLGYILRLSFFFLSFNIWLVWELSFKIFLILPSIRLSHLHDPAHKVWRTCPSLLSFFVLLVNWFFVRFRPSTSGLLGIWHYFFICFLWGCLASQPGSWVWHTNLGHFFRSLFLFI